MCRLEHSVYGPHGTVSPAVTSWIAIAPRGGGHPMQCLVWRARKVVDEGWSPGVSSGGPFAVQGAWIEWFEPVWKTWQIDLNLKI